MADLKRIQINGVVYDVSDPVAREELQTHAADTDIHITSEERSLWNSGRVTTKTTSEWNAERTYVLPVGYLGVYSDFKTEVDENGNTKNIPAIKVGDGITSIVDLPFLAGAEADIILNQHISNAQIHVTEEERKFWNNKVSCAIDKNNSEKVIFSTT